MLNKIFNRWEFYYLLMIAALPLVVNPFELGPYEIPKQIFLIFGVVFAALYFIINSDKKITFLFNKYVFAFALLWLFSLALSAFFGVAPIESFWGSTERMQGLFSWILYLLHFFICLQIFQDEKWRKVFLNLVIATGIILSAYAILQHFRIDPLGISDINEASGRSFATLGQPNFLGQWLIFPFVVFFMRIFYEKDRRGKNILILLLLVTGLGLATTFNRASILGIFIGLLLFLIRKFRHKFSKKICLITVVFTISALSILVFAGGLRSVNSRLNLVKPVFPLVQQNLLIGAGPETIYQTYQKVLSKDIYLTENLYDIPDRIHNETLQTLLDQGIFGFALYFFLIAFLINLFFKKEEFSSEQAASYFAVIAYFISVQFSFSISAHMVILLAMMAILTLTKLQFSRKTIELKNIFQVIFLKIAVFAICIFYLFSGLSILIADVYFNRAISNYFETNDDAVNYFDLAIKRNPNSRYYLYSAVNLLSAKTSGRPDVKNKIEKYLERLGELTNYGYHYNLAMGDFENQEIYFKRAAKQAPNWPFIWQEWGGNLFEEGNYAGAADKYEKLMELAPPYWKWSVDLENHSFAEREKYRLFKKNNELFYLSMRRLISCYEKIGQKEKADELSKYLPK